MVVVMVVVVVIGNGGRDGLCSCVSRKAFSQSLSNAKTIWPFASWHAMSQLFSSVVTIDAALIIALANRFNFCLFSFIFIFFLSTPFLPSS